MGAWGYSPYDNDTAGDWFYGLEEIGLYKFIESGLNSNSYDEQRAAAWLVQRLAETVYVYNVHVIDEHRALAVKNLQNILNDKEWIDDWNNPSEIVAELEKQIYEIENPNASPGLMQRISGV